jgi:hypothetical protein
VPIHTLPQSQPWQVPHVASNSALRDVGWTVTVGSMRTGNLRAGSRSQAWSTCSEIA